MRWLLKALAQKGLSAAPGAEDLNFLFQRRLTRSLPQDDAAFRRKTLRAVAHLDAFLTYGSRDAAQATFYEFGTGWDLVVPLVYVSLGVDRQVVGDIRSNLRLELVNDTLVRYERRRAALEAELGRPLRSLGTRPIASLAELRARYGVEYLAPLDARRTDLASESIDFVSSTNTLEHVPEDDIAAILAECRRLLRPDGALSCRIDMKDHHSYFDRSLSPYHFLKFSDRRWALVNSPLNYQNRLRYSDYRRLLEGAGFDVVAEDVLRPTETDLDRLRGLELDARFRDYPLEDLGAKSLVVVARPCATPLGKTA